MPNDEEARRERRYANMPERYFNITQEYVVTPQKAYETVKQGTDDANFKCSSGVKPAHAPFP